VQGLFLFPEASRRAPGVAAWFAVGEPMRDLVQPWFERLRSCGEDVLELIHDGRPTACAGDAAFAYVDAFRSHASIGFFFGAALEDPGGLLEGAGVSMRHVKLRWGRPIDRQGLERLIALAYADVRMRRAGGP
jgi:hypothetical protein